MPDPCTHTIAKPMRKEMGHGLIKDHVYKCKALSKQIRIQKLNELSTEDILALQSIYNMITSMHRYGTMKSTLEIMSAFNIDPEVFVSNWQQLLKGTIHSCRTLEPGCGLCAPLGVSVPQVAPAICLCIQNSLRLTSVDDPPSGNWKPQQSDHKG